MVTYELIFFSLFFLIFYTYIGYGLILYVLVKLKRFFTKNSSPKSQKNYFSVSFVVAAYNEAGYIEDKIKNCLAFDYPRDKIKFVFVTDGSNDKTPDIIRDYPFPDNIDYQLFHSPERRGKIAAVNRIMPFIDTPIVIYTDANTDVNPGAIKAITRHYMDDKVGAVAGEKRVSMGDTDEAAAAGEGFYWKYESKLKNWDSELNTVVGAAGELFSIRTALYEPVDTNTVIEDFVMTLGIAMKGYKVVYEPEAFAVESASASVHEELKRKIRIAAGGIQAIVKLSPLLNIFKYGLLSFQYLSHRVLRWTVTPFAIIAFFFMNIRLSNQLGGIYNWLLIAQVTFYLLAIVGWIMAAKKVKVKIFFIPYYFCVMNYAVIAGIIRYFKGSQSVVWEKAKRAK